jgi:hypothetical protein
MIPSDDEAGESPTTEGNEYRMVGLTASTEESSPLRIPSRLSATRLVGPRSDDRHRATIPIDGLPVIRSPR